MNAIYSETASRSLAHNNSGWPLMAHRWALACVPFLLACFQVPPATADEVVGISDGDTLTVVRDGRAVRVRLANIDAPEKTQPFGERSKKSLSDICYRVDAKVDVQSTDKYGRLVAVVTCNGAQANREQVERGYAWVYHQYNTDSRLPAIEEGARTSRSGLWSDSNPIPPWQYRRQK